MCKRYHVKYPLFLADFNETNFIDRLSKKTFISNFIKIRAAEFELFHEDRQSTMTKLTVAFRNFANEPKNYDLIMS
jgi:hypothetical protein